MIVCPNCGRDNEDHYKFCLGCGTELTRAPRSAPAPVPTSLPQPSPVVAPAPFSSAVSGTGPEPDAETQRSVLPTLIDSGAGHADAPPPAETMPVHVGMAEPPADLGMEATLTVSGADVAAAMIAQGIKPEPDDLPFDLSIDAESLGTLPPTSAARVLEAVQTPAFEDVVESEGPTTAENQAEGVEAPPESAAEAEDEAEDEAGAGADLHTTTPEDARLCGNCGAAVPDGFKFCGVCGTRYEGRPRAGGPVFVPNVQDASNAPARLVVIHPDGTEGDTFSLGHNETTIGRSHPAPLFAEDPFLSPRHARFYFVKGQLFARDEGSLNGVFVRIKAEVELFHGDYFRIGQQLLRFEEMAQVRPVMPGAGDGTMVMGSPLRGAWGRLSSIVALNTPATVWVLRRPEEQLGRERGDITFPEDGFVSGAHCKLAARDSRFFLQDLGSTNGSYLRVKAEGILSQGDLILLGQQLFRVELNV